MTRLALQLAPHVFVRPGELRSARWEEIDLEAALWTIPAAKTKMRKDHRVPLSRQVVDLLQQLHAVTGPAGYVFPSVRTRARPMSKNMLNAGLRRLGNASDEMTAHGFRVMAETLAGRGCHTRAATHGLSQRCQLLGGAGRSRVGRGGRKVQKQASRNTAAYLIRRIFLVKGEFPMAGDSGRLLADFGVVSALLHARSTGQVVDCAMLDGSVALGAIEPQFHARLLVALGLEGDAELRVQRDQAGWPALKRRLEAIFRTRTRDEW